MNLQINCSYEELKNNLILTLQENAKIKDENSFLKRENLELKEQNEWFRKQIFGKRSEKEKDLNSKQLFLRDLKSY